MLFIDIDKIKGVESKEGKSLKGYETDVHRSSRNRKVWEGGREREKSVILSRCRYERK